MDKFVEIQWDSGASDSERIISPNKKPSIFIFEHFKQVFPLVNLYERCSKISTNILHFTFLFNRIFSSDFMDFVQNVQVAVRSFVWNPFWIFKNTNAAIHLIYLISFVCLLNQEIVKYWVFGSCSAGITVKIQLLENNTLFFWCKRSFFPENSIETNF